MSRLLCFLGEITVATGDIIISYCQSELKQLKVYFLKFKN